MGQLIILTPIKRSSRRFGVEIMHMQKVIAKISTSGDVCIYQEQFMPYDLYLEQDDNKRKVLLGNVQHDVKQAFLKLVNLSGTDMSNENVLWLSDFLSDISRIDKESDMFRYPFDRKLNTLFKQQTHVYLPATYYNMNRAFELLKELLGVSFEEMFYFEKNK